MSMNENQKLKKQNNQIWIRFGILREQKPKYLTIYSIAHQPRPKTLNYMPRSKTQVLTAKSNYFQPKPQWHPLLPALVFLIPLILLHSLFTNPIQHFRLILSLMSIFSFPYSTSKVQSLQGQFFLLPISSFDLCFFVYFN